MASRREQLLPKAPLLRPAWGWQLKELCYNSSQNKETSPDVPCRLSHGAEQSESNLGVPQLHRDSPHGPAARPRGHRGTEAWLGATGNKLLRCWKGCSLPIFYQE